MMTLDDLRIDGDDHSPTLVLAHGAGAPMDSDFMNATAEGLARRGLRIVRFEFPYMQERRATGKRRPPNGKKVLRDCWREVVDLLDLPADELFIGGKSMGGRIASQLAAELRVRGLVCLGYPFHPPGKPDKLRTAHLEDLRTPTLIVQGTRDRLGDAQEVAGYTLSDAIKIVWLEDGDHSFKPRKRSGRTYEQNMDEAIEAVATFVHRTDDTP